MNKFSYSINYSKKEHSISHEEMPSFEKHVDFVKNHPYRKWWLVESEGEKIGSVYLSVDNAVGINLLINDSDSICHIINQLKKDFEPLPLVPSVRPNFSLSMWLLIMVTLNKLSLILVPSMFRTPFESDIDSRHSQ